MMRLMEGVLQGRAAEREVKGVRSLPEVTGLGLLIISTTDCVKWKYLLQPQRSSKHKHRSTAANRQTTSDRLHFRFAAHSTRSRRHHHCESWPCTCPVVLASLPTWQPQHQGFPQKGRAEKSCLIVPLRCIETRPDWPSKSRAASPAPFLSLNVIRSLSLMQQFPTHVRLRI